MKAMGWDLDTTLGKLHRLWWWCLDYAIDGRLCSFTASQIGAACDTEDGPRLMAALIEARFVEEKPELRLRNWWEHAGEFLRYKLASKPELLRGIQKSYSEVTTGLPQGSHVVATGLPQGSPVRTTPQIRVDKSREDKKGNKRGVGRNAVAFQRPTLDEVREYCAERGGSVNPEKWLAHYEANGWKVGRNPMKDWKAAVRTWEAANLERGGAAIASKPARRYKYLTPAES
jgi:hypothetical protein